MRRTPQSAVVVFVAVLSGTACVHRPSEAGSSDSARSVGSEAYQALGSGHFIRTVTADGQFVTLDDNSVWEIEPSARYETADWQPEAAITVRPAQPTGPYSYELTNTQEDEGALARYVSRR